MAVKNTCPKCGKGFTAPENYIGKKVDCPRCGQKVILRSPEEINELVEVQAARLRKFDEDQERLALIEKMDIKQKRSSKPYYETYGTGESAVRHFNPNAPSRFLRFRALSEVFTFFAYFEALLVVMGIGLTLYLKINNTITSIPVLLLCLIGWGIIGTALYLALKFLGELAFLLSDVGDQQNDVVQLLLDVRDNTESTVESEL